jgi:MFS family permease
MAGGLLHERDARLVISAVGISALGDFLALVPLALYLQGRTDSGVIVALLFVALWAPSVVLAGPAGGLVDRIETRRLLLFASLAQAGVVVALAFVHSTGSILALVVLLGSLFAVAQPAEFALIPPIAGDERLAQANGYVETARYTGMTLGPALGGLVAAHSTTRVALLVDALTFLYVAAAAAAIRTRRTPAETTHESERGRNRDGIVFLLNDSVLSIVMTVAFVSLVFMTASASAELFFAKKALHAGDAGYGFLITAWTFGMAIGALVLARRVPIASLAVVALAATAVQGAGIALPTLWLVLPFALVAYAIGGTAHGLKNVVVRTLMHIRVPDRLRGRTFAAYNGLRNGAELIALVGGGVLVNTIGARWTLLIAGAVPAVLALFALRVGRARLVEPATGPPAAHPVA